MATRTFTQTAVLGLYTETPLHCGAESAIGYVDLPIQRERHTAYPVIPGSTIKGVLKDEMSDLGPEKMRHYFGESDQGKGTTSPGQVSFGDGIIVAFPVRSTEGPFQWVTCPFALERALRALGKPHKIENPEVGEAWAKVDGDILLEELLVVRKKKNDLFDQQMPLTALLDLIPSSGDFEYTRDIFLDRLLVLNDGEFQELVETGTEVLTRIKLNALGTTDAIKLEDTERLAAARLRLGREPTGDDLQGNMFVEEVVPPETLLLTVLRAPRNSGFADEAIPRIIRIGGDETIGRGVTRVTFVKKEG
ncbi:MAG: type III-B CRISPR module RAMP protein Cmr4 [Planctomycetes bacterium]|nr:type III-B CRISPR module RAMP protein Cmr4 [Planctomycetota bacterium]